ncbi:DUF6542 domain-containing protein [Cumulibacter manganitolerans]|uniref:DUF6542 domain-containing protein n=1 Tax=Cumulibacter manganitolerans TaxID=1884992 RepID=UPI001295A317|nr:DUF6542 domain-containing protein [Cumulibacter manganitolerans]
MNDEHEPRRRADDDPAAPRSKWAVRPGFVDDSFGTRRGEPEPDAPRTRRPASEIIGDVRARASEADYPTRSTVRRPGVPAGDRPRPRLDPDYAGRSEDGAVRRAPRAPLYDESTRVEPEMGENRDLKAVSTSGGRLIMAGFGGVILIVVGGLVGAIVDFLFTDRIGVVTAIGLTLAAAVAALVTRKRDLLSIIVAPPLVYAVVATVVLLMSARTIRVTSIADLAIRGFPAMALATGLAALIAGIRLLTSKKGERS